MEFSPVEIEPGPFLQKPSILIYFRDILPECSLLSCICDALQPHLTQRVKRTPNAPPKTPKGDFHFQHIGEDLWHFNSFQDSIKATAPGRAEMARSLWQIQLPLPLLHKFLLSSKTSEKWLDPNGPFAPTLKMHDQRWDFSALLCPNLNI